MYHLFNEWIRKLEIEHSQKCLSYQFIFVGKVYQNYLNMINCALSFWKLRIQLTRILWVFPVWKTDAKSFVYSNANWLQQIVCFRNKTSFRLRMQNLSVFLVSRFLLNSSLWKSPRNNHSQSYPCCTSPQNNQHEKAELEGPWECILVLWIEKQNSWGDKGLAQGHGFESGPEVSSPASWGLCSSEGQPGGLFLHEDWGFEMTSLWPSPFRHHIWRGRLMAGPGQACLLQGRMNAEDRRKKIWPKGVETIARSPLDILSMQCLLLSNSSLTMNPTYK